MCDIVELASVENPFYLSHGTRARCCGSGLENKHPHGVFSHHSLCKSCNQIWNLPLYALDSVHVVCLLALMAPSIFSHRTCSVHCVFYFFYIMFTRLKNMLAFRTHDLHYAADKVVCSRSVSKVHAMHAFNDALQFRWGPNMQMFAITHLRQLCTSIKVESIEHKRFQWDQEIVKSTLLHASTLIEKSVILRTNEWYCWRWCWRWWWCWWCLSKRFLPYHSVRTIGVRRKSIFAKNSRARWRTERDRKGAQHCASCVFGHCAVCTFVWELVSLPPTQRER